MKTLILTESQIKRVLDNVINEQFNETTFNVDFGNAFDSGQYNMNPKYMDIVNSNVSKIAKYIGDKKLTNFKLEIHSGESQVPNQVNPDTNVRFGKGELAKKRSDILRTYLESVLPRILGYKPLIEIKQPIIGPTKWDGINKDHPKYKKEQFVKVAVVIKSGTETPPIEPKRNTDVGEGIYMNNRLIGYISEPFVDSKSSKDSGFQNLGRQELIFTEVKPDTQPPVILSKYKIPFEWWNEQRSYPTTKHISIDDFNYIKNKSTKVS
jgi:hypothetical protein